jgi:hypothetical protein
MNLRATVRAESRIGSQEQKSGLFLLRAGVELAEVSKSPKVSRACTALSKFLTIKSLVGK